MTAADAFVVASHLSVDPDGATTLEEAFANRLGEVEHAPGFRHLEVWRDASAAGSYVMVTWWDREEDWRDYMGSPAHRRSHARVPRRPHPPRPTALHRYEVVAR